MKKAILSLLAVSVLSCSVDQLHETVKCYRIDHETTFKETLLIVTNETTNDTIYRSELKGRHEFELEKGNTYHIDIRQDKLDDTRRKYTKVILTDVTESRIIQETKNDDCLRNWGYYLKVR